MTKVNRRDFCLFGAAAGFGSLAAVKPALAMNSDEAKRLVTKAVGDINSAIASGKSGPRLYSDFERVFYKYSDVNAIARYVLGVKARELSSSELSSFSKAFAGYLSRKYGKRFRDFRGNSIKVKSARAVKRFYEVKGQVAIPGQQNLDVIFLVSDRSGKPLFFNLFIEGINMLITERNEIGALLDARRGDIGRLLKDLPKLG